MKKILFFLSGLLLLIQPGIYAQRQCGFSDNVASIKAHNPSFEAYINSFKNSLQSRADNYKKQVAEAGKPSYAAAPVPVVFHIVVDSDQFKILGSTAGISQRCDSQIAVLNRDYNRQNPDSVLIPSSWKPLYASVGIHFGLARIDPSGNPSPGYTIKIIPGTGFIKGSTTGYSYPDRYRDAKHNSTGGVDAWDVTRYANVWCINFSDNPGLLGSTVPKSWTPNGGCDSTTGGTCPEDNNAGVCINFGVLGKRASSADNYPLNVTSGNYFDKGRTLTHEMGHFFEIWHVWGDDFGLCPWDINGGSDDGLWDTPPQGNNTYNNPHYTIAGGTFRDTCKDSSTILVQPIGIACLDYLDYTDDTGMHLFTPDQAAVMQSMLDRVGGENFDLVRYPRLTAAVPGVLFQNNIDLTIAPNPTKGAFNIMINAAKDDLRQVSVTNILGQEVYTYTTNGQSQNIYSINLSTMSKGIYFVHCTFATGSVARKILLQ